MTIILLENGEPARLERIPDDNAVGHLADLLGGELDLRPLASKLLLATVKDAQAKRLPIRYRVDTRRLVYPIYGNCAVVRHMENGNLCNISQRLDLDTVDLMIHPIREAM